VDPDPLNIVQVLETDIDQLNIEWSQAFKDQMKQIEELRKISNQDIQYIVGIL
jgi:hypothetical protein